MTSCYKRGFTFIEILVAMILFGLLSAMAVPRYHTYKERAYLSAMRSDLGHLRIAEEAYFAENQQYVADTTGLDYRISSQVRVVLTSTDLVGGYTAVATHLLLPGQQCATYVGMDAVNVPSGAIICATLSTGGVGAPLH